MGDTVVRTRGAHLEPEHASSDERRHLLNYVWIVVLVLSVVLRLAFVCTSHYAEHQHDSGGLNSESGHAVMIYQVATRGLDSLNIDPMSHWSFYNPPLHYWLAAGVFNLAKLVGVKDGTAMEAVQLLIALYTTAASLLGVAILRKLGLRGERLSLAASLWCALPMLIPLSGQLSPDALFALLSLGAIYLSISWFKNPTLSRAAALGLCCGLSIMTKSSGTANLAFPGIVMLMQLVWVKPRLDWKKALLHSAVALVIAAVVGGWWHVRALAVFNMPLGYMQKLGEDSAQNIRDISPMKRLFDISFGMSSPFLSFWTEGATDYNVFLSEVKSYLFDELKSADPWDITCAYASVLLCVMYAGVAFYTMLRNTLHVSAVRDEVVGEQDRDTFGLTRCFAALGLVLYAVMATYLAFKEPFSCSMSFRYIIPFALFLAYFMGEGSARSMSSRWVLAGSLIFFAFVFHARFILFVAAGT